ncbi:hypothetical protein DVH24_026775 [Malus domestica]|uniref:Uncharacterized protein n=1 Tax=Malus domestica TaxID=3750 RepID=A0A498K8S0_MALDO|nr:hypothetical protein DVH24_026775 [Malus domestica]
MAMAALRAKEVPNPRGLRHRTFAPVQVMVMKMKDEMTSHSEIVRLGFGHGDEDEGRNDVVVLHDVVGVDRELEEELGFRDLVGSAGDDGFRIDGVDGPVEVGRMREGVGRGECR